MKIYQNEAGVYLTPECHKMEIMVEGVLCESVFTNESFESITYDQGEWA